MLRISMIEIRKFDTCSTSVYNSIVLYESVHSLTSLKRGEQPPHHSWFEGCYFSSVVFSNKSLFSPIRVSCDGNSLLLAKLSVYDNRWMLSFSSILNEIAEDSIEALHYCKIDVKIVKNV